MSYRTPSGKRKWRRPTPLGFGAAIEAMSTIAAPLLAGFSITLMGVISQAPEMIRWPGAAILALAFSSILLVACVQFGFRARTYLYSKTELEEWESTREYNDSEVEHLYVNHEEHFGEWERWSNWARRTYNAGIVLLGTAVAITVAPPEHHGDHPLTCAEMSLRWASSSILLTAAAAEAIWIICKPQRK